MTEQLSFFFFWALSKCQRDNKALCSLGDEQHRRIKIPEQIKIVHNANFVWPAVKLKPEIQIKESGEIPHLADRRGNQTKEDQASSVLFKEFKIRCEVLF